MLHPAYGREVKTIQDGTIQEISPDLSEVGGHLRGERLGDGDVHHPLR